MEKKFQIVEMTSLVYSHVLAILIMPSEMKKVHPRNAVAYAKFLRLCGSGNMTCVANLSYSSFSSWLASRV